MSSGLKNTLFVVLDRLFDYSQEVRSTKFMRTAPSDDSTARLERFLGQRAMALHREIKKFVGA